MSIQACPKRLSVTQIRGRKGGDKLVCLTAYTSSPAEGACRHPGVGSRLPLGGELGDLKP
jgi:hypothetical protein